MAPHLTLILPNGTAKARAVIFDMDGVISDTQTVHAGMESALLREHGINLSPEEITREFAGVSDEEMFPKIFARHGKPVPNLDKLIEEKWQTLITASRGKVRPISGTLEFIEILKTQSLPVALASSSRRPFIELVLEELKLGDTFDAIVSADEVERGKPDPAIFLLAAERLGLPPQDCLVIEDAVTGMLAARRAGMLCIGLVPRHALKDDYPADLILHDLRKLKHAVSQE